MLVDAADIAVAEWASLGQGLRVLRMGLEKDQGQAVAVVGVVAVALVGAEAGA